MIRKSIHTPCERAAAGLRTLIDECVGYLDVNADLLAGSSGAAFEVVEKLHSLFAGAVDVIDGYPADRSEAKGGSPGELSAPVVEALDRLIAGFREVATERDRMREALSEIEFRLSNPANTDGPKTVDAVYRLALVALDPAPVPRDEWPVEEFDAGRHGGTGRPVGDGASPRLGMHRPPVPELSVVLDPAEVVAVTREPKCSAARPCEICAGGGGSCCAWAAGDGAA